MTAIGGDVARLGFLDRRAQANLRKLLRSDIHEGATVKTGARRSRDFPDIHSASSAIAERHERVCGCSHLRQRRRTAPGRPSGYNLSPALDLDLAPADPLSGTPTFPLPSAAGSPGARLGGLRHPVPRRTEAPGGPYGEGPRPAVPSPQDLGPQAPTGPPAACVATADRLRLPT
jgi:hypothetical protein